MAKKWYSNGLKSKGAKILDKYYAKIVNPKYNGALTFSLELEDGSGLDWVLSNEKDIKKFLALTNIPNIPLTATLDIQKLEGKVIEVYGPGRAISVNENLI